MAAVRQVVDYVSAWWWPSQPIGPPIEIKIHLVYPLTSNSSYNDTCIHDLVLTDGFDQMVFV
jgi:hypothetical protein